MKFCLCTIGLCVVLVQAANAGDAPQKLKNPAKIAKAAAAATAAPGAQGRKQLEAMLQSPAKLDFSDRQHVTVRDVLNELHKQHHLSLRFDIPTLTSMLEPPSFPAGVGCPPSLAVGWPRVTNGVPFGVLSTYAVPCGCPPQGSYYPPASSDTEPPQAAVAPVGAAATIEVAASAPMPPVGPANEEQPGRAVVDNESNDQQAKDRMRALMNHYRESKELLREGPPNPQASTNGHPPTISPDTNAAPGKPRQIHEILEELLETEIDLQTLDLSRVSIATVLRQALDTAPTGVDKSISGSPMLLSNAMVLDYVVEDDGLLITSRMKALTTKETRVYSIKHLSDLPPEQLCRMIRQSIRPWSWRSQINDLGDQLKGTPLPTEALTSMLKTGVQLVGAESGIAVIANSTDEEPKDSDEPKKTSDADVARQMELVGNALANGLVTLAQSTLLAMEMVHYAEPPTGTIQCFGSKLIITQSQAAHREIAELLKQLSEE